MANMSLKKNPMPSQEPDVRNKNFDEVALGYTEEMAIEEPQVRERLPRERTYSRVHRQGGGRQV